jgi:hypothetical protein
MGAMKSKIILALTVLITLAVTSANAQSVRERQSHQRDGIGNDYRHGKISRSDRHRLAKERNHFRHDRFRNQRDGQFSHHDRKRFRHENRKGRHQGYSYRNNHRKFD